MSQLANVFMNKQFIAEAILISIRMLSLLFNLEIL